MEQLQAIRPCQVMATSRLEAACKRFHLQCQATSADLIELYKAVDKCSLDSSLKQVVLKAVDEKMLIPSSETKPLGQHQVLAYLCNYLTGKDYKRRNQKVCHSLAGAMPGLERGQFAFL